MPRLSPRTRDGDQGFALVDELELGYLLFRPPTRRTVQILVDDVIIPSLTRPCG
jgi:hypothetical protein